MNGGPALQLELSSVLMLVVVFEQREGMTGCFYKVDGWDTPGSSSVEVHFYKCLAW